MCFFILIRDVNNTDDSFVVDRGSFIDLVKNIHILSIKIIRNNEFCVIY